jgi:hypothetical protein
LVIVILLSACGERRALEGSVPVPRREADALWEAVEAARPAWTGWEAKARLDFADPNGQQGATAVLRMRRDTLIWLSIRKAGIEGARLLIRPDSAFVLDRTARTYTPLATEDLAAALGSEWTFDRLQALFTGEALLTEKLRWRSGVSGGRYVLEGDRKGLAYRLELDPADLSLRREEITETATGRRLVLESDAYKAAGASRLPTERRMIFYGGSSYLPLLGTPSAEGLDEPVAALSLDFSQVEPDPGSLRTDFDVNPRYELVPWAP